MSSYVLQVIALCILSSLAVVMLSPSPAEKLELELSTMPAKDALAELDRAYSQGERNPNLVVKRAELSLEDADIASARESLESLADQPEHAVLAQELLARHARELGDLRTATTHLAKAYELAPSQERLQTLATSFRLLRRTDDEERLLVSADPSHLPVQLVSRLLELLLTRGDVKAAETVLRARLDMPPEQRGHARAMLAELMIGSQRANDAAVLAAKWLSEDGDAESLARVTSDLLRRGFVDQARTVATVCLDAGLGGAHATIAAFSVAGHGSIARELLGDWLHGRTRLSASEQAALLSYTKTMNDFSAALALLRRAGPEAFDPSFVLGVIEGTYRRFGGAALTELLPYLKPEILKGNPLLAAEMSLSLGQHIAAARYLVLARAEKLERWDEQVLAKLAQRLKPAELRFRIARYVVDASNK